MRFIAVIAHVHLRQAVNHTTLLLGKLQCNVASSS